LGQWGGRVLGNLSHRWVVGLWTFGIALLFFSIASFILVSIGNKYYTQISIAIGAICGFSTYILVRDRDLTVNDLEQTHKIREPYLIQILPLFKDMQIYLKDLCMNTELDANISSKELDDMTNEVTNILGGWKKTVDASIVGYKRYGLILAAGMQAIGAIPLSSQIGWDNLTTQLQQIRIHVSDKELNDQIKWHLILLEGHYYYCVLGRYIDKQNIESIDLRKKIAAIVSNKYRDELLSENLAKLARRIEQLRLGKKVK